MGLDIERGVVRCLRGGKVGEVVGVGGRGEEEGGVEGEDVVVVQNHASLSVGWPRRISTIFDLWKWIVFEILMRSPYLLSF